jgi:two-component system, NtrC family, response regulator AlgB
VRGIAATNRNLEAEMAAGRFRDDLFYRLNVIEVTLPPLRERAADILPLAKHLLGFFARQTGKPLTGFSEPAGDAMVRYPWPGNIRELRNAIERGAILASGPVIELDCLPTPISSPTRAAQDGAGPATLDQMEAEHIRRMVAATATIEEAATKLGIDPSTLYRKRKKYGI